MKLDVTWRKSSRSNTDGACVEVRAVDEVIEIRDTNNRDGGTLRIHPVGWTAFVQSVRTGEFAA
jgi:hypothetical protein